ncbi:MAG: hypothetical protein QOI76_417 [Frankiales bacterium]|nr:hypothetical protein [Frankiales bacterium]
MTSPSEAEATGARSEPSPVHHAWLAKWEREVEEEYNRLHARALQDPQHAGHGGEATWIRLFEEWLPPAYEVGSRKYIVPEQGDETFETDIVVFNPGYPARLREREEVLAGGVAAAFSVKLTLDAAGLRDAVSRGARLRRAAKPRYGSPRGEALGAFAFGLLAHSHSWRHPGSTPRENLVQSLWQLDHDYCIHPRETLDLLCIADLTTVTTLRASYLPALMSQAPPGVDVSEGTVMTVMSMADEEKTPGPVAVLIAALLVRLAYADPTVKPFADGLRLTDTLGSASGHGRYFPVRDVYSEQVLDKLPTHGNGIGDWASAFH